MVVLSYGDLDQRARRLAGQMQAAGVGRETVVALAVPKSADYLVGMLATWYAGGAFLPLDPTLPAERQAFMVKDADARLIYTREDVAGSLASFPLPRIRPWVGEAAKGESDAETFPVRADDLAYVIYTSGSTGTPKGVMVPHRGILNLIDGQIPAFGLRPGCRVLWYLSPSFDASVSDIGTALLSGATLCIEPGSPVDTASDLLRVLTRRRITHLDLPPALLTLLNPEQAPACLETLVIGGEPCPPEVVRRWARRCRVVNVYGPTEATVCASLCPCDPATWCRPLIGAPLPNVTFQVLDDSLCPVAPGEPGELFIGGIGLARGYVNRPELTAARFLMVGRERLYRTGDRVIRHPDGALEFLGRTDRQVKVRGLLVAPEEVEARLLEHPGVRQAAVVKRAIGGGREGLVAFIAPTQPGPTERDLRSHLRASLPAWMEPQLFHFLARLPVTRTGKTDHAALLGIETAPLAAVERTGVRPAEPLTPRQAQLVEIWEEVLGQPGIGLDDDFFERGGDSLAVLRAAALAEARGLELSPAQLIRDRTLAAITRTNGSATPETWGGMATRALRDEVRDCLRRLALEDRAYALATARSCASPRTILLTGATGFLGSRLLCELLMRTKAHIFCLVRAEGEGEGLARISAAVERHGLPLTPADRKRVVSLCGDLAHPHLGLNASTWKSLCEAVETIYHCGAWVNVVHSYAQLRPVNLEGTAEVLRLISRGRPKQLHYASTLSVFVSTDRNTGRMEEGDDLTATEWVYGGYGQTKWAAEHLVCVAQPYLGGATLYRLGLITGDTKSGYAPERDQMGLFIRGLARLGCVPAEIRADLRVDITPVDYAAAAMAHLSLQGTGPAGLSTFHIAHPRGAYVGELIDAVRAAGVDLEPVGESEWRERVARRANAAGAEAASTAFLSLCRSAAGDTAFARQRTLDLFQATGARFAMENTRAGLAGSGLRCPDVTPELLLLYARRALGQQPIP